MDRVVVAVVRVVRVHRCQWEPSGERVFPEQGLDGSDQEISAHTTSRDEDRHGRHGRLP